MKIKITADSTCDLSEELLKKWDIALMPMHILMGEDSYLDGVTVHPADVFAYVNRGGKMPKSAAANLVEYTEFFAPFAKEPPRRWRACRPIFSRKQVSFGATRYTTGTQ